MVVSNLNVAVVSSLDKLNAQNVMYEVVNELNSLGINILMNKTTRGSILKGVEYLDDDKEILRGCDLVIIIGGDGTIIHEAKNAAMFNKPVLGINAGRIGFVAALEADEIDKLDKLVTKEYIIEKRMMIRASINKSGVITSGHALNDVVISGGAFSGIIDINVSFNNDEMCKYRADGLIISTPTGSTAYSLSAGGPIIEPKMKCMLVTPICSHSLSSRPVLFGDEVNLTIRPVSRQNGDISVMLDGRNPVRLENGDFIEICAANKYVELIKIKDNNFYTILNDKLSERRIQTEG